MADRPIDAGLALPPTRRMHAGLIYSMIVPLFGVLLASCAPGVPSGEPSGAATRPVGRPIETRSTLQTPRAAERTDRTAPATGMPQPTPTPQARLAPIPSPPAAALAQPLILAIAASNDRYDIYVLSVDGSTSSRLTHSPDRETAPSWSPDLHRIAFISRGARQQIDPQTYRPGRVSLQMVNADGTGLTDVTGRVGVRPYEGTPPRWSFDGLRLAYVGDTDEGHEIFVIHADGTQNQRVTPQYANASLLGWSLDNQRIFYETLTDVGTALVETNLSGGQTQRVIANLEHSLRYALSPDQTKIAAALRDFDWVVGIRDLEGGEWTRVPNPDRSGMPFIHDVIWSPDGSRLVFVVQYINTISGILVVDSDGTHLRRLEDIPFFDYDPIVYWFQDSRRLAYRNATCPSPSSECEWGIRIADTESGQIEVLDEHLNANFRPVLSPDGERFLLIGQGEEDGLYVMNADGSGLMRILDLPVDAAVWAPGGAVDR